MRNNYAFERRCALVSCPGRRTFWPRLRDTGTFLHGKYYCRPECLKRTLAGEISRLLAMNPGVLPPNRVPLGLLMMARGKLTHLEVRAALEIQRRARYGKIGEWFEKLGFATEEQVTAALALQWGCPVVSSFDLAAVETPGSIPLPILEAFQMLPVNYTVATKTLYVAFGERVDHAALYTIDRILDCRTQPCVGRRKAIARQLDSMRQMSRPSDIEFVTGDLNEMARITGSYISRLGPQTVGLGRLGRYIWLRMKARSGVTNLLFSVQSSSTLAQAAGVSRPARPVVATALPSRSDADLNA